MLTGMLENGTNYIKFAGETLVRREILFLQSPDSSQRGKQLFI